VLLNRLESVDERDLRGKGRQRPVRGILFLATGLGLKGSP
jgi:hypothetical protein